jgi:hypothetical protein
MSDDILSRILKIKKDKKAEPPSQKRTPQSRPQSRTNDKVEYQGVERNKRDVQAELDRMSSGDKMVSLTTERKQQVIELLIKYSKEDGRIKDGASVYAEYREAINLDIEEDNDDAIEAWWCNIRYLKLLHKQRKTMAIYEDLSEDK